MSSKNSHTNFIPKVGSGYSNEYLWGVITDVSLPLTAKNGKEYFKFEVLVTKITDSAKAEELEIAIGSTIYRMATPERRLNGTFNKLKNANQK